MYDMADTHMGQAPNQVLPFGMPVMGANQAETQRPQPEHHQNPDRMQINQIYTCHPAAPCPSNSNTNWMYIWGMPTTINHLSLPYSEHQSWPADYIAVDWHGLSINSQKIGINNNICIGSQPGRRLQFVIPFEVSD
jgi:hypothetical protein